MIKPGRKLLPEADTAMGRYGACRCPISSSLMTQQRRAAESHLGWANRTDDSNTPPQTT